MDVTWCCFFLPQGHGITLEICGSFGGASRIDQSWKTFFPAGAWVSHVTAENRGKNRPQTSSDGPCRPWIFFKKMVRFPSLYFHCLCHLSLKAGKLTWQWKTNHLKMYLLSKMVIFQPVMLVFGGCNLGLITYHFCLHQLAWLKLTVHRSGSCW